jgi:membrane protease YdiL (CAAX protease family)
MNILKTHLGSKEFQNILRNKMKYYYFIFFVLILTYTYLISDPILKYFEVEGFDKKLSSYNYLDIISIVLIIPFIEELLFRGYLTGHKQHLIFIIPQIAISVIILNDIWFWILTLTIIVGFFLVYDIIFKGLEKISKISLVISFFYSSLLFSFVHSSNFQLESAQLKLFLSIVTFFPGAIFLGLIRIKEGLVLSTITHSIMNLSILSLNQVIY